MTLQRRLVFAVLAAAPLAWLLAIAMTYLAAQDEIDELYDTEMVRLAQQLHAILPLTAKAGQPLPPDHVPASAPMPSPEDGGDIELGDLAIAAWRPDGTPLSIDPDGDRLPRAEGTRGFRETEIDRVGWRLYYMDNPATGWRVVVGQLLAERHELIRAYVAAQILPWAAGLPVLIGLLIWSVRRALAPVHALSTAIEQRSPDDPSALDIADTPGELRPLVRAMNRLLLRSAESIDHERRLTADAAHELRTPLAALKAQWEVARRSPDPAERKLAFDNVEAGMERMTRLVSQLLTMSRLESATSTSVHEHADWQAIAGEALSGCLLLAQQRNVDVELSWPTAGMAPLPVNGDGALLGVMLRNLLDNAIRFSHSGAVVRVDFRADTICVRDRGPGVSDADLPRLGDRFFRANSLEPGHGLGLSIAKRIAQLHGLEIELANCVDAGHVNGLTASIRRPPATGVNA